MSKKIVYEQITKERLDTFLSKELNFSRSKIQKLIKEKSVLVNDKAKNAHYLLESGDEISINSTSLLENRHSNVVPEDIKLNILFEDKDILVINKPKNMVVHLSPGHESGTLVNALKHYLHNEVALSNDEIRPGIVHRIDKDTSGILVVAKNDESLINLQKQFKEHTITRKYYALVRGTIIEDNLKIDLPIGRSAHDRKKMSVVATGRKAVTLVKVLKRFAKYTLIECELKTGRTHQIRVHLSHIKHPLVGDIIYGLKRDSQAKDKQFLFAYYLGFLHPKKNDYIDFQIKTLPEYFENFLKNLN